MTEDNKVGEQTFENDRAGTADAAPIAVQTDLVDHINGLPEQERHAGVRPSTPYDAEMFQGESPKEVTSEEFHVPVATVMKAMAEENLASVAIVGLNHDGQLITSGSHGSPMVIDLLTRGLAVAKGDVEPDDTDDDGA